MKTEANIVVAQWMRDAAWRYFDEPSVEGREDLAKIIARHAPAATPAPALTGGDAELVNALREDGGELNRQGHEGYFDRIFQAADRITQLCAEVAESKKQAKYGWDRHAEKDAAYQKALDERDAAQAEVARLKQDNLVLEDGLQRANMIIRAYSVDPSKIGNTEIAMARYAQDQFTAQANEISRLHSELAALRAEVARLRQENAENAFLIQECVKGADEVNAEIAALRGDKARLDWLLGGSGVEVDDGPVRRVSILHYRVTRDRIDAAMSREGETK